MAKQKKQRAGNERTARRNPHRTTQTARRASAKRTAISLLDAGGSVMSSLPEMIQLTTAALCCFVSRIITHGAT
jgi:hypothetical protein